MKERVTFLHDPTKVKFSPDEQIRLRSDSLRISSLTGARQDQFIFGIEELPQEVLSALKQCRELHIRWAPERPYAAVAPFSARVPPGLHVFFTPQLTLEDTTLLCKLLPKVFGRPAQCTSPSESFTAMPALSDRFAHASGYNFHAHLPFLGDMAMYLLNSVCGAQAGACLDRASVLVTADALEIDWDFARKQLVLTAFRQRPPEDRTWEATLEPAGDGRLEVGVLARDAPSPAATENLALGGFLSVVGKDDAPDKVLFTFAARHHDAGMAAGYSVAFVEPTGLHPTMRLTIAPHAPPAARQCALHAHLTMPSVIFPDKYQLSAPMFLASKNLHNVRAVWGETDLEAPDWAVTRWGSSMVLELAPPGTAGTTAWHADVPLHLRYLPPAANGTASTIIPWPVVFWACRADAEANLSANPFDRTQLGYDALFGPNTLFYHVKPDGTDRTPLALPLQVPVLDTARSQSIESITAVVIAMGFVWVLWKLLAGVGPAVAVPQRSPAKLKKRQ